jgi:hypothetical protein
MKLTKGKLSKIYNKKRQTMRKLKKNGKKNRRGKTFRKRRPLNLYSKTLKKVLKKGGTNRYLSAGDGNIYQDPEQSTVVAAEELGGVFGENEPPISTDEDGNPIMADAVGSDLPAASSITGTEPSAPAYPIETNP